MKIPVRSRALAALSLALSCTPCAAAFAQSSTTSAAPSSAAAQPAPCSGPESQQFDFWVGDWDLEWPAGQAGTSDKPGHGRNSIRRTLGGCVVQENFEAGPYIGSSTSVYVPTRNGWRQTWVDNQGAYIALNGEFKDGKMELRTDPRSLPDGSVLVNRMVYANITHDAFDWAWQSSKDGGKTWTDNWNIHYMRRK